MIFRRYELVLGFLAATALWAVLFALQPKYENAGAQPGQIVKSNEIAPAHEVDNRLATYNLWLAIFTAVLAGSTIGLWIVTWRSGVRQSRDMQGAIGAAQAANKISHASMVADQRAWVTVGDLQIDNDLIFRKSGAGISIFVKVTNVGKTPALAVHTSMEMIFDYAKRPNAVKELSKKTKSIDIIHWTRTLLPGESYRRKWGFTVEPPEPGGSSVFPVIIGCTTYRITPDESTHQTGFVFDLFECESGDHTSFVAGIDAAKPLTRDRIGWDGGPGGFAD